MHRIHMVCMPYQNLSISSLSTALLSTIIRQQGVPVSESYFHFEFANTIGVDAYLQVTNGDTESGLLGELFFAEAVNGRSENSRLEALFGEYETRQQQRSQFLAFCLENIDVSNLKLVGFTTSFNQLFPSLWLAREIKQRWPEIKTVLGGSACTGTMGSALRDAYRHIDCVVSGNGERILSCLATGRDAFPASRLLIDEAPVELNELPVPDYDPFIEIAKRHGRAESNLKLAYESSRGCWWGEKHQCSFCGINGANMRFAAKTPDRVYSEIRQLWEQYGLHLFSTDSILAREHLKKSLPLLAKDAARPLLFYEVKANLMEADVKLLHDANVRHIQPGIESLSTHVLDLMHKGVGMLQNLALLKWCREWGINVSWNLLYGVPGETAADYATQMEIMSKIPHFTPPTSLSRIRIDRFSPYFYNYSNFGWTAIKPLKLYSELHQNMPATLVSDLAYHFEGQGDESNMQKFERPLYDSYKLWVRRHDCGDGLFWDDSVGLFEMRNGEVFGYNQSDILLKIIRLTNAPIHINKLQEYAKLSTEDWEALFQDGILIREKNKVLNLAVCLTNSSSES